MPIFLNDNVTEFFSFTAQDENEHSLKIVIRKIDNSMIEKIGQYPSVYDLNEEINNKSFLKLLDDEYRNYYKTACSLYSFNSCIGAMTYLRRIFEKLLIDAFNENRDEIKIEFNNFKKLRMEEKIETLKKYLPDIMYENGFNKIYSNISDGIHNLTEEECSTMFVLLKSGIEEILMSKLEKKEKNERRKKMGVLLNKLKS